MNISFLRNNLHAVAGTLLLTAFSGTALALYFEVPAQIKKNWQARCAEQALVCPHHGQTKAPAEAATAQAGQATHNHAGHQHTCPNPPTTHDHAGGDCGHAEGACCQEKQKEQAAMILPPGHPPVPGFTVASEPAKAR